MASNSFLLPHSQRGHEQPVSNARLAAEAFFAGPRATVPDEQPQAHVIVKRKRVLQVSDTTAVAEPPPGDAQEEQRAPKVHLLAVPVERGVARERATGHPEQTGDQPRPRRRRRRELNGEVTIIRPEGRASRDDAAHATPELRPAMASRRGSIGQWSLSLGYPILLAEIEKLEHQARLIKQREGAVLWISQAIRQYGLTAEELGF